ncbi:MAG: ABC transporter transmembrane domain-containing protein, partial [Longimicrobiales bacterium]
MERDIPKSGIDTGLACLAIISGLHGIPADPRQLRHNLGLGDRRVSSADIVRAARSLGFKAGEAECDLSTRSNAILPAIGADRQDRYFVLARVDGEQVLVQSPSEPAPVVLAREAFRAQWNGRLILIARRASVVPGTDAFGFSWFIPAILRYRNLLYEVLLASFFIQLFALVTPIFFQVVIDKVLVHRGLSTLDVLAAGLFLVYSFEVLLNGLRNYVFSHTTNRIDVTLGTDLFRHLLRLPLGYFETRRVGDTVARVREL